MEASTSAGQVLGTREVAEGPAGLLQAAAAWTRSPHCRRRRRHRCRTRTSSPWREAPPVPQDACAEMTLPVGHHGTESGGAVVMVERSRPSSRGHGLGSRVCTHTSLSLEPAPGLGPLPLTPGPQGRRSSDRRGTTPVSPSDSADGERSHTGTGGRADGVRVGGPLLCVEPRLSPSPPPRRRCPCAWPGCSARGGRGGRRARLSGRVRGVRTRYGRTGGVALACPPA